MTLKKFDRFESFDDVMNWHRDLLAFLSFDDLNLGNLKTTAPTTDTIDKGKFRLVEESGVPVIYYRSTGGSLYKLNWTAV